MKALFSTLLIIGLAVLPSIAKPQDASLVVYFSFDDEEEEEVQDHSQYGNNGTLGGNPEWTDGKFGKALAFDSVDDQVVVPTNEKLDIEEDITMMAWAIAGDNLLADWRTIVGKSPTNVLGENSFAYDIRTDQSGVLRFSLNIGGTWTHVMGPVLKIDQWYHIAGTYDGKEMVLYLDGVSIGKTPTSGKINVIADPLCVGNIVDAGGAPHNEYWSGAIDEVRVWNRALSEDEVTNNMGWGKQEVIAVDPQEKLATTWGGIKGKY